MDREDFSNIFDDALCTGEDNWFFENYLSDDMNVDFGSFSATDREFSPKDILTGSVSLPVKEENEISNVIIASSVPSPAVERSTEVMSSSSASKTLSNEFLKPKVQSPPRGDGAKTSALCSFLAEGLTEFAPWTGFDYNSDDGEDEEEDDDGGPNKKRKRTKQKPPNPDAELIAAATEENLRQMNIDPDSKEGKKQRRRIRNRLSAQFHRERKKNYILYLEGLIKERDTKLQEASKYITDILKENENLKRKLSGRVHAADSSSGVVTDYSSSASTTCASASDIDGEDSDTISVGSSKVTEYPSAPNSPFPSVHSVPDMTGIVNIGGSKGASSLARSGVSLFSVLFMLGITLFSPMSNRVDENGGAFSSQDPLPGVALNSLSSGAGEGNSFLAAPLQMLQLPGPEADSAASTGAGSSHSHSHGRVILSVSPSSSSDSAAHNTDTIPVTDNAMGPTKLVVSSSMAKPVLPLVPLSEMVLPPTKSLTLNDHLLSSMGSRTPSMSLLTPSQAMWKVNSPIADLFPGVSKYQYSALYMNHEHEHDLESLKMNSSQSAHASGPQRVKRNLRTRFDLNASASASASAGSIHTASLYGAAGVKVNTVDHQRSESAESDATSKSLVPRSAILNVPSSPQAQSFAEQAKSIPTSPDNVPVSLSMSRVLLTQGRALLDPSLLVDSIPKVIPTHGSASSAPQAHSHTHAHSGFSTAQPVDQSAGLAKALSTWTASGPSTEKSAPVISVGLPASAPGAGSGEGLAPANMLVMLLPASAIRWGKIWGESSEGNMESMLHGLNITEGSAEYYKAYGAGGSAHGANGSDSTGDGGVWVEIGCSILRAQLVRNVTLSS